VPRFLVADCSEFWRRFEGSPLRREAVELALARGCEDVARRMRSEGFDAVLVGEDSPEAAAALRELEGAPGVGKRAPRLVILSARADAAEVARDLGLACRRRPRSRRPLRVEVSDPQPFRARTRDASPAGLFLVGAPELDPGTRLQASLRRPGGGREARVALVVVRRACHPEESHQMSGLGVSVEPASPEDGERLERWLATSEGES
jgi:hypothetical protein